MQHQQRLLKVSCLLRTKIKMANREAEDIELHDQHFLGLVQLQAYTSSGPAIAVEQLLHAGTLRLAKSKRLIPLMNTLQS